MGDYENPENKSSGSKQQSQFASVEYKSKTEILGMPLIHMSFGVNPKTGVFTVAKGIIAIGNVAIGIISLGGFSLGILSLGGISLGIVALGGMAFSVVASLGGVAVSLYLSIGGLAIAREIAVGGLAISLKYAIGGFAIGKYPYGSNYQDPKALEFLKSIFGDLKW